jgi:mono/diheme cytochrome c family protein
MVSACVFAVATQVAADSAKLTRDEAKKLNNPVPYSKKSIDQGRTVFLQNCTGCHGQDGKAEAAIIADATDLTNPSGYKDGTTEGEIYRSIRDGAGDQMPPFKTQLDKEEDLWNLVNFVRSLWPEGQRPKLQE